MGLGARSRSEVEGSGKPREKEPINLLLSAFSKSRIYTNNLKNIQHALYFNTSLIYFVAKCYRSNIHAYCVLEKYFRIVLEGSLKSTSNTLDEENCRHGQRRYTGGEEIMSLTISVLACPQYQIWEE